MTLPDRRDSDPNLDLLLTLPGLLASVRPELPQAEVEVVDMAEFLRAEADFDLVPKEAYGGSGAAAELAVSPAPSMPALRAAPSPARDPQVLHAADAAPWQVEWSASPAATPSLALLDLPPEPDAGEARALGTEPADAAIAAALRESERLEEAEAALAAADAAVRDAEQNLIQLRRAQSEQRLKTDAQRSRTIQARLEARAHSLRQMEQPRPGGRARPTGPTPEPVQLEADTNGFQPTLPLGGSESSRAVLREASILTILPLQRRPWEDAANRPRMGRVLVEGQRLTPQDVEMVLMHQTTQQRRFGEIAVALGLLEVADVVWALHHQQPGAEEPGLATGDMLVLRDDPGSAAARVIRDIAGQVVDRSRCAPAKQALALVSPSVGDGKSTLAVNLAMALAERGRRVLLIDTDLEGSRIRRLLPDLPPSRGLAGVLRGEQRLAEAIVQPQAWRRFTDDRHGFHLLPAGAGDVGKPLRSAEVARDSRYIRMVLNAVQQYDDVLLDSPAASRGPAMRRLARLAGTAMAVARPGHTPNASLDSLTLELRRARTAVLGVVMNSH